MYLLYSFLLVAWGILLIPVFLYRAWRYHKYLPGLSQRLGRLPETLRFDGRSTIWFHSCSVGETLSLQPLVYALHKRFPEARLVFSTITKTGQEVAAQRFARFGEGNTFYFPVDLASVVNRVFRWIVPAMIVIVDTEIWPNLLHNARRRGIPVTLANGRISARSFRYYRWARPLLSRVFPNYRLLMMQSEEDAHRINSMGAPMDKILVTGNIKFDRDTIEGESDESRARDLEKALGLTAQNAPLIVAGSTHPDEEQILLEVLKRIQSNPDVEQPRLLIAPRHPERFEAVVQLIVRSGFRVHRRTDGASSVQNADILLLDTVGELATAYRFATIVFVGGSLSGHGGHSIMEPALYSKPIVTGPSTHNFRSVIDEFLSHGAIRQISAGPEDRAQQLQQLEEIFVRWLRHPREREAMGAAAYSILERNRGAAQRTFQRIAAIFEEVTDKRSQNPVSRTNA